MPPRKKARTAASTVVPRLDGPAFVAEFAKGQTAMLEAMALRVKDGGLRLDDSSRTDHYIEAVISDWCSQEEPDRTASMEMIAAVFLLALLDEVYEPDNDTNPEHTNDRSQGPVPLGELMLEALRTARSIFGRD